MSIVTGTVQGICKQTMLLWLVFSMAGIVVAAERLARKWVFFGQFTRPARPAAKSAYRREDL
jgi:hypothetical protein